MMESGGGVQGGRQVARRLPQKVGHPPLPPPPFLCPVSSSSFAWPPSRGNVLAVVKFVVVFVFVEDLTGPSLAGMVQATCHGCLPTESRRTVIL
jgi:hypothetical protein